MNTVPQTLMARQYLLENYPWIADQEALIATMPDLRDLKSDWAKEQVGKWTMDSAFDRIVEQIDALSVSEETDKELFALLLDAVEKQRMTSDGLKELEDYNLADWTSRFDALAYLLLSPVFMLFLLFRSHHVATEQLVRRNEATIVAWMEEIVRKEEERKKRLDEEPRRKTAIRGKKKVTNGDKTKATVTNNDEQPARPSTLSDYLPFEIVLSIDRYEDAELFYSLIPGDRETFTRLASLKIYRPFVHVMFDRGNRSNLVISRLIEEEDESRLLKWLNEEKGDELPDDVVLFIQDILSSPLVIVIRYMVEKWKTNVLRGWVIAMIEDATIHPEALKVIVELFGDEMNAMMQEIDQGGILRSLIMNRNAEYATTVEVFNLLLSHGLKIGETMIDIDSNEISPLEYALRFSENRLLIRRLLDLYTIDPIMTLYRITDDFASDYIEESTTGLAYLLETHTYTHKELMTAMRRCDSAAKIHTIIDHLDPGVMERVSSITYTDAFTYHG